MEMDRYNITHCIDSVHIISIAGAGSEAKRGLSAVNTIG